MKTILIVAAHPDDEVLGVGGTIVNHVAAGDEVRVIILGEGVTSRNISTKEDLNFIKDEAKKASGLLGVKELLLLGFPDNRMDSVDLLRVIKEIEKYVVQYKPHTVYTHHSSDLNIDHQIVNKSVLTACRPLPNSSVKRLFAFETLSSSEWSFGSINPPFKPQKFVNITQTFDDKKSALKCYSSEIRNFPHPRSIEAVESLARLRGSQVGVPLAESFEVIFDIENF